MRVTVFTCIVGQTDALKAPTVINPQVRYVCLSDRPQRVPPYHCVRLETAGVDVRLLSRQIKILSNHPCLDTPDVSLWHDAAYQLNTDPVAVAAQTLTDRNMVAFKHPHRTQIEEEAVAITKWNYVPKPVMDAQVAAYRADGFTQTAITSTGFCLRRLVPRITAFNAFWWNEVQTWGWRDQMSVDYALWKTGVEATYIDGHYRNNPYAKWYTW